MRKVRKVLGITLILAIMLSSSMIPYHVEAKTFGQLKQELKEQEAALRNNQQQQSLTEEQMQEVNQKIAAIQENIKKTYHDIENLNAEIEQLKQDIAQKEEQIKEIINFAQLSRGDSTYLEYIFNADDFTDLIYRSAIAEQLSDYNDKLIDEFNQDIENNKKKQKEIEEKRETLSKQQAQMEKEYDSLGNKLNDFVDAKLDIEDQISYLKEMVDLYKELGCTDDQDLDTCKSNVLPSNTKFYRPLVKGFVTSEYGYRTGTFSGFHSGIDSSVSPASNVYVYASGTGIVSGIVYKTRCGGTYVLVHHKMTNGQKYTTMYMHLYKPLVSKGDIVTKDTPIGIMGGGKNTPWDKCSTGAHSHFTIATGLYGVDYTSWSAFMAHTFNPRTIVNFPSGRYNWFSDRLTKY